MKTAYSYIRLSSTRQGKGTGIQRQTKLSTICQANGWKPSDRTFLDFGVSAWKGKNRLKGDLAMFIQLAKDKKLDDEPVLVIEAFDRFSRQNIDESEPAILDLLKQDCAIHVAFNNKTFTKDSTKNLVDRIEILVSLKAAFDYSENLSKRIKAQRTIKTARMVRGEVLRHNNAPRYYSFNPQKRQYEQNKALTPIIKRIITQFLKGDSLYKISNDLNNENVRSLRYADKFANYSRMSVKSILINKCLYGEFLGIPDYFAEPVIDKATFDKVQALISRNSENRGRYSTEFINIFRGIAECSSCHSAMSIGVQIYDYKNKKEKATPWRYLRCSCVSNGKACDNRKTMHLAKVEAAFFDCLSKNPIEFINGDGKADLKEIDGKIAERHTRLNKITGELISFIKLIEINPVEALIKKYSELTAEQKDIQKQIDILNAHRSNIIAPKEEREWLYREIDVDAGTTETTFAGEALDRQIKTKRALKDNEMRQKIRQYLPNEFSKIVFDTNNGTFEAFNRAGNRVFKSQPI